MIISIKEVVSSRHNAAMNSKESPPVVEYLAALIKPKMLLAVLSNGMLLGLISLFYVAGTFAWKALEIHAQEGLTLPRVNDHLNVVDQRDHQAIEDLKTDAARTDANRQQHFDVLQDRLTEIEKKQISSDDKLGWIFSGGSLALSIIGLLIGAGVFKLGKLKDVTRQDLSYPIYLSQPDAIKIKQLELYTESLKELVEKERIRLGSK